MTSTSPVDAWSERVGGGGRLAAADVRALAEDPDILPLGMLADAARRFRHGNAATYLRVASAALEAADVQVPDGAGEVRIDGSAETADEALAAVSRVKASAGGRAVSAYSWADIVRLAGEGAAPRALLADLRSAGLDALASLPLDYPGGLDHALAELSAAGFTGVRLSVERAAAAERVALFIGACELADRYGTVAALDPLPRVIHPHRPTTGYEDVKMVAVARLAAPSIPTIQVDWLRYGPKLAQVALTFGADDLHGVSASDEAPEGRRRAPLEEVRRNIEAAGFVATQRDGRFQTVP